MAQPLKPASLPELLARARAGDSSALEQVLVRVEDSLRRYLKDRLGMKLRQQLRDSDVLQNAYIEMLRLLPAFVGETEGEFVAWVMAIIENDIRRQNRWFSAKKRKGPSSSSERDVLARILFRETPTPSKEVMRGEDMVLLQQAMQQLSEDHYRVIQLAVIEGRSHKEVAGVLGRPVTATRMLLSRARAALSIELERLDQD